MVAENITVTRSGNDFALVVDGVEIPANAIRADSVVLPVDTDDAPTVCLELIAHRVDVTNTLTSESETP